MQRETDLYLGTTDTEVPGDYRFAGRSVMVVNLTAAKAKTSLIHPGTISHELVHKIQRDLDPVFSAVDADEILTSSELEGYYYGARTDQAWNDDNNVSPKRTVQYRVEKLRAQHADPARPFTLTQEGKAAFIEAGLGRVIALGGPHATNARDARRW